MDIKLIAKLLVVKTQAETRLVNERMALAAPEMDAL
jgi:hypothetical protein